MGDMGKVMETPLPESMIHHIQSFMTAKEAARTTILSKSWYNAWLTRPTIDLDVQDFLHRNARLEEFVKRTVQRYQDSNLKIQSFRVRDGTLEIKNLIAMAMKFGATDCELEFSSELSLPQEVFGSETLIRLSIKWSRLEGNYFIRCSRLKSLTLDRVLFRCDDDQYVFKDLITSCVLLEELTVSSCNGLAITRENLNELHNLRRLILSKMDVDRMFFTDFASRFPCLNNLSILHCDGYGCTSIHIATTSLQTINYEPYHSTSSAMFDVPNIRKFTYASCSLSSKVSINGALKEWDCDVSISSLYFPTKSWFSNLKKLFKNRFKRSRVVSLSIGILRQSIGKSLNPEPDEEDLQKPFVVDNLRIIGTKSSCALLLHLLVICRPKFITLCLHSYNYKKYSYWSYVSRKVENERICEKEAVDSLCQKVMHQVIAPNCGIPDQDLLGKFGVKRVNMEAMDKFGDEWRPLVLEKPLDATTIPVLNKRKVRFEFIWD